MRLSLAWALVAIAVAACGGDDGDTYPPCRPGPAEEVRCENTCGNGQIDTCWWLRPTGCGTWVARVEECDGEAGATCEQLGYYGGEVACTYDCRANDSGCTSCAPGITCSAFTDEITYKGAALNGTRIALIGERWTVTFLDGLSEVGTQTFGGDVGSVVGVPGGWLVAHDGPPRIAVTNLDGEVARVQTLATNFVPALQSGPGGRVLLVWAEPGTDGSQARYAIANSDATSAVPGGLLFDAFRGGFATHTDGTSFFVGAGGRLARITADGVVTVTTGLPSPLDNSSAIYLTSSETTSWYIAYTGTPRYTAQRFDASGALVGAPIPLDVDFYLSDVVADGDDLLLLHFVGDDPTSDPRKLVVERFSPAGASATPMEIGIGVSGARMLARTGELLVTWQTRSIGVLAFVTPP